MKRFASEHHGFSGLNAKLIVTISLALALGGASLGASMMAYADSGSAAHATDQSTSSASPSQGTSTSPKDADGQNSPTSAPTNPPSSSANPPADSSNSPSTEPGGTTPTMPGDTSTAAAKSPQIGPYYSNADGSMSTLAKHIKILNYGGWFSPSGTFSDATVTGDWRKTETNTTSGEVSASPEGLHIWQQANNPAAKLKICVVDPSATGLSMWQNGCLPAGSLNSGGYEVSTTLNPDNTWPEQANGQLSVTVSPITAPNTANQPTKYVYVKLGEDLNENTGTADNPKTETFPAGTIVKLPIVRDASAPSIAQVSVNEVNNDGTKGNEVDFSNPKGIGLSNDGELPTSGKGIMVTVGIDDAWPQGAHSDADVAAVSGPQKLMLTYKNKPVPAACTPEPASKGPAFDRMDCQFTMGADESYLNLNASAFGRLGKVSLSDFSLQAVDNMGNTSTKKTLVDFQPFKADSASANQTGVRSVEFYAFPTAEDVNMDLRVSSIVGSTKTVVCGSSQTGPCTKNKFVQAKQAVVEPVISRKAVSWFNDLEEYKPRIQYSWRDQKSQIQSSQCDAEHPCDISTTIHENEKAHLTEGEYSVTYSISYMNANDLPLMISHAISGAVGDSGRQTLATLDGLCVDGTSPRVNVSSSFPQGDWLADNSYTDGTGSRAIKVVATHPGENFTYTVSAKDCLGSAGAQPSDCDENGVSGMSELSLTYKWYANYDDALKAARGQTPATQPATKTITPKEGYSLQLPIQSDGAYVVSDISVTAKDMAGNTAELSAADSSDSCPGVIVVDGEETSAKSVAIKLNDAAGTPTSDKPNYYHRGSVRATLTVNDKWFEAARQLPHRDDGLFTASLCKVDMPRGATCPSSDVVTIAPNTFADVKLANFSREHADGDAWSLNNVNMPVSSVPSETRSAEGKYALHLSYVPIGHSTNTAVQGGSEFCIDYTSPWFGAVNYSTVQPNQWGWIFADGDETVSVKSSDAVSGVNDGRSAFDGQWSKAPQNPDRLTSNDGQIAMTFGTDSQRLTLSGSKFVARDKAGNESQIDLGRNLPLPGETHAIFGIAIDRQTPRISVAYDNNDVRNGKYYKANRHATVTITESNFDFIKDNDQWRSIVTSNVDGSRGASVAAKDFKNASGDGLTWTAQLPCEHDGDWAIDVGLTDPAGHVAAPYHSDFTIDTVKPLLGIKFDNNSAQSGNYYKAARHAVIKQTERNFSGADTVITVSAKDAGGASVASPSPSPWTGADKDYGHTANVDFTHELHYTLKVQATDLAGNVAEAVEEPEFIIDTTSPKLSISNVADKTAYAGDVMPKIDYSDTNFDPMLTDYTLTRTHKPGNSPDENAKETKSKANSVYVDDAEHVDATSKNVSFKDIEHTVDNDDVYTLTASIRDKAGNETKQKVVYSLNRFGSDYIFDGATQNSLGKYIKAPHDVRVTEVNVSGIDSAKSHMELVHDSDVRDLKALTDYSVAKDSTTGWQVTTYDFPAKLFASDGYYRLRLTSVDTAGNLSQNTMNKKDEQRKSSAEVNFAVDGQAPQAQIAGLSSRSMFYSPSHDFVANAKDDVALRSVEMRVDGKSVGKWNGKSTLSPMSYNLRADEKSHDVQLVSTDMAGNKTVSNYGNVVVASSWWAYAMARGFLLPAIAVAIVLLALIILAIVLMVRHHKQTAYRRNVFGR